MKKYKLVMLFELIAVVFIMIFSKTTSFNTSNQVKYAQDDDGFIINNGEGLSDDYRTNRYAIINGIKLDVDDIVDCGNGYGYARLNENGSILTLELVNFSLHADNLRPGEAAIELYGIDFVETLGTVCDIILSNEIENSCAIRVIPTNNYAQYSVPKIEGKFKISYESNANDQGNNGYADGVDAIQAYYTSEASNYDKNLDLTGVGSNLLIEGFESAFRSINFKKHFDEKNHIYSLGNNSFEVRNCNYVLKKFDVLDITRCDFYNNNHITNCETELICYIDEDYEEYMYMDGIKIVKEDSDYEKIPGYVASHCTDNGSNYDYILLNDTYKSLCTCNLYTDNKTTFLGNKFADEEDLANHVCTYDKKYTIGHYILGS